MGNCGGKLSEEDLRNRQIEKDMQKSKIQSDSKIKLLLLGAGESGKSTLFKQMKILFTDRHDFSEEERKSYIGIIHSNIIVDLKTVISAAHANGSQVGSEVLEWGKRENLTSKHASTLQAVWTDESIVAIWENRGHIQVQDALEYFMDSIERICDESYVPNNSDILRSRVRTTGVVQETFKMGEATFEMYDVGGQRNERRKWMHSFEKVTSVIFVAAVSEYNQVLYEDNKKNRQEEAIELFRQQLESKWFLEVPFILFLNKKDLLREKLIKLPFKVTSGDDIRNEDYDGDECVIGKSYNLDGTDDAFEKVYEDTCDYLKEQYLSQQDDLPTFQTEKGEKRRTAGIYTHFTNSTDTENVSRIMNSCKDIILRIQLQKGGWVTGGI